VTESVLELTQSTEDDRPDIATIRGLTLDDGDINNCCIIRGDPGRDVRSWKMWQLYVKRRGSSPIHDWDYYGVGSTSGLFSQKAYDVLKPSLDDRFIPLPGMLEGVRYYFLHPSQKIDCLNVAESEIEYFADSTDVMLIRGYKFYKDRLSDPMVLAIPQWPLGIFTTESIPNVAKDAGLRGLAFTILD